MNKLNTDHSQCHEANTGDKVVSVQKFSAPVFVHSRHNHLSKLLTVQLCEDQLNDLWLRGSYLNSLQAAIDWTSTEWREYFLLHGLERDIRSHGPRIHANTFRRLWTRIAFSQGEVLNIAALAKDLGVSVRTISRYLDIFDGLKLVRILQPWNENVGKRLVKSPKVFVRDSGLMHALIGINSIECLLNHSIFSRSWEGFCLETLISVAPKNTEPYFYKTSVGTKIDLVLRFPNKEVWAFEIKRNFVPKASRGFHTGAEDIKANRKILIYLGEQKFIEKDDLHTMSLPRAIFDVQSQAATA